MTTENDTTPAERPTSTEAPPTTGPLPGATGEALQRAAGDRAGNTGSSPPGSSSTAGNTVAPAAAEATPDWLGLLARVTQIESRLGQLEGRGGNLQDQISGLHTTQVDHHTILSQHDEQLEQLHGLVGAIHDAVIPNDAKPMRRRDEQRQLPPASGSVQVGAPTFTPEGRETELHVDPTKPGEQLVRLPSGQEVVVNVRPPQGPRPSGGVVRGGRRMTTGTRRR